MRRPLRRERPAAFVEAGAGRALRDCNRKNRTRAFSGGLLYRRAAIRKRLQQFVAIGFERIEGRR